MSELIKKRVRWKEYNGEELVHDEDVDVLTSASAVTFSDGEDLQDKYTQGQLVQVSTTGILSNLSTTNKSSLVDAVNEVKTDATSNTSSITSLTNRVTTAESDIDSLEGRTTTNENDIDSLESRMTTAESDIDGLESDVTSLEGRMTTAESNINHVEGRMTTAESDIDSLETRVTPISLGGTGATTSSEAIANLHGVERTTADITYYVNASTGSDSNDGLTENTAFATIQHAIDIVPKYLAHKVTIRLASGTYNENVTISGFVGKERIFITGSTLTDGTQRLADAVNYKVGSFTIKNNSAQVILLGLTANGTSNEASFRCDFSSSLEIYHCRAMGKTSYGYMAENSAKVITYNCYAENKTYAFNAAYNSEISVANASGSGNTNVILANWCGMVRHNGWLGSVGTTMYAKWQGGVITNDGGNIASTT